MKTTMLTIFANVLAAAGIQTAQASPPSITETFAGQLSIGAAVEPEQLTSPLLAKHFNSLVAENAMKPAFIHPTESTWNFGPADEIANYARTHHMTMRGHTLIWYRSTPGWMFLDGVKPASKELVLARLRTHIEVMMKRYGDVVHDWDVVNEVVDPTQPDCYRRDKWFDIFGSEYINHAFGIAKIVDPTARLFINDYSTTEKDKRGCLIRVIKQLKDQGVPIDGIGHQMHISLFYPSLYDVDQTFALFAQLGIENEITEMDMGLLKYGEISPSDSYSNLLKAQGKRYEQFMRLYMRHGIKRVTFWGISDDHTWRSVNDQPLLFDKNGQPKPAFWGVVQASKPE